jgi:hypothetical protein
MMRAEEVVVGGLHWQLTPAGDWYQPVGRYSLGDLFGAIRLWPPGADSPLWSMEVRAPHGTVSGRGARQLEAAWHNWLCALGELGMTGLLEACTKKTNAE